MKKIKSQQSKPFKETRKGVKPNHAKGHLVNVTDGVNIRRVHEMTAADLVSEGWRYCPKKFRVQS